MKPKTTCQAKDNSGLKFTAKVTALLMGAGSILPAHAFLNDTSSQRVIMIGKGGAQNMQKMQVDVPTQLATQAPSQISLPASVTMEETTTISKANTPSQPQSLARQSYQPDAYTHAYQTPTYGQSAYTPPIYTQQSHSQNYTDYAQFDRLALTTNSAAVAVIDMQTGNPIYEKNMDSTRSIASITKMMTAMVVMDSNDDMRQEITIRSSDLVGAKQASTRLKAGDRLSRSEFMLMMLMKSENPAAKALASNYHGGYEAFIAAMNAKAQSLGMNQTRFSDSSGLNPRNVSSARDLVVMMREIATNPRYQTIRNFSSAPSYDFYITNYSSGNRTYKAASTSPLVRSGSYPISASKTGFTKEAGYCVVMETSVNGRPSIIVLLGAKGSQNRWSDAQNILGQLAYR